MRRIVLGFAAFGVIAGASFGTAGVPFGAPSAAAEEIVVTTVPPAFRSGAPALAPFYLQAPVGTTTVDGVRLQATDGGAQPSYYNAFGNQPLSVGQQDLTNGYSQAWECASFGHGC